MKYDVITIGGATEDITFFTREGILIKNDKDVLHQNLIAFKYGSKVKIDSAHSTFGGGAANAAVNFAGLGLKVAARIAVGTDNRGAAVLANLQKRKVSLDLVQKLKTVETGFSFLLMGQGNEHVVFSNRAANERLQITARDLKVFNEAGRLYLTSLSGDWESILAGVFKSGTPIAWNPGHRQLKGGIKKISQYLVGTDVLIVNKDEAIELVYSDLKYRRKGASYLNDIKNLLLAIKGYGPRIVVITNGRDGAECYDGATFYHQDIMKEQKVVDTTGVGDCFGSTFTAGLQMFKGDICKALLAGVINTASVVGLQGAQNGLLGKREILRRMHINY